MKSYELQGLDGAEGLRLVDRPVPHPAAGQVLVRMKAATLNYRDLLTVKGGYASGLYSSRRIAKACRERNDFVMIVALDPPDFRTISDFRKRHLKALGALFLQVLKLCEPAALSKLGHVALDGTKIKANASKQKPLSYERITNPAAYLKPEAPPLPPPPNAP